MKTFKAPLLSRISALPVQPGEQVASGQVIAVLTPRELEDVPSARIPGIRSPIAGYVVIYPGVAVGAMIAADAPVFSIMTEAEKVEAVAEGGIVIQATQQVVLLSDQPLAGMPPGAVRIPVTPPAPGLPARDRAAEDSELGPKQRAYGRGAGSPALGRLLSQEPQYQILLGWRSIRSALRDFPAHLDQLTDDGLLTLVVMAAAYSQCGNYAAYATLSMLVLFESIAHGHQLHPDAREIVSNAAAAWSVHRSGNDAPACFIPATEEEFARSLRTNFGSKTCEELFREAAHAKAALPPPPPPPAPVKAPEPRAAEAAPIESSWEVPRLTGAPPIGAWVVTGAILLIIVLFGLCSTQGTPPSRAPPSAPPERAQPAEASPPEPPSRPYVLPAPHEVPYSRMSQEVQKPSKQKKHTKHRRKKHKRTRHHKRH